MNESSEIILDEIIRRLDKYSLTIYERYPKIIIFGRNELPFIAIEIMNGYIIIYGGSDYRTSSELYYFAKSSIPLANPTCFEELDEIIKKLVAHSDISSIPDTC
jgi:hypothetical protein